MTLCIGNVDYQIIIFTNYHMVCNCSLQIYRYTPQQSFIGYCQIITSFIANEVRIRGTENLLSFEYVYGVGRKSSFVLIGFTK